MLERLNCNNENVIKDIEVDFKKRIPNAKRKAILETKELVEFMHYYRTHSFGTVCTDIKNRAKKMFVDIDDEKAFRSGLFQNIQNSFTSRHDCSKLSEDEITAKVNDEINDLMKYITESDKTKIIENYKKNNYKHYVETESKKAFDLHDLFNEISEEEIKDYVDLFNKYRLSEALYDARVDSVVKVCSDIGTGLPLCLDDDYAIKAVDNKIASINKVEPVSEEKRNFIDKIKDANKKAMEVIYSNPSTSLKIGFLSWVAGGVASMSTILATNNGLLGGAAWLFTTPALIAGLSATYRAACKHDTNVAIDEAKKTGLFDRKEKFMRNEKNFLDYTNMLKEKYTSLHIEEGNNGLHL